ncbi:hypothetical protein ACQYAD_11320 [Neobacillus sp. SM06]|uniref:hypothetical protein n=1 Tax=Neobacillus sp. SM06 TaxID=3422492 RepID=UPI003D28B7E3
MVSILIAALFVISIYYLLQYRLNLKKAVDCSQNALYPTEKDEFESILIPSEWKEMEMLSKDTKSYKFVNWGTTLTILLLMVMLWIVVTTNWLDSTFLSFAYLFFLLISAVKHRGNLFVLPKGLIVNGRFYTSEKIKGYEVEKIVRWHELYGLDTRLNHAFKLTIHYRNKLRQSSFVVVEDCNHLNKIINLLNRIGIKEIKNFARAIKVPTEKMK